MNMNSIRCCIILHKRNSPYRRKPKTNGSGNIALRRYKTERKVVLESLTFKTLFCLHRFALFSIYFQRITNQFYHNSITTHSSNFIQFSFLLCRLSFMPRKPWTIHTFLCQHLSLNAMRSIELYIEVLEKVMTFL